MCFHSSEKLNYLPLIRLGLSCHLVEIVYFMCSSLWNISFVLELHFQWIYKARHAHKRLYTVLPKYSKIQVLPGITSCRLMKYNEQAIELNSLLINNMPKDGYG